MAGRTLLASTGQIVRGMQTRLGPRRVQTRVQSTRWPVEGAAQPALFLQNLRELEDAKGVARELSALTQATVTQKPHYHTSCSRIFNRLSACEGHI